MSALRWVPPLALLALNACVTAGPEFRGAVSALEQEYGIRANHFAALAPLVWVASPAGISEVDAATFESLPTRLHGAPDFVAALVQRAMGRDWKLVVRSSSRADGEWTLVYASPSDVAWRLMVFTLDDDTLTVAHVMLDPAHMREWIEDKVGKT